jgi:hypothetical protein
MSLAILLGSSSKYHAWIDVIPQTLMPPQHWARAGPWIWQRQDTEQSSIFGTKDISNDPRFWSSTQSKSRQSATSYQPFLNIYIKAMDSRYFGFCGPQTASYLFFFVLIWRPFKNVKTNPSLATHKQDRADFPSGQVLPILMKRRVAACWGLERGGYFLSACLVWFVLF